ncbi:Beta-hexosaminidase 3 [Apostasia shenzhenica]|uniref:Beta-hexosaminidase n=1 Tax=Apostasia shenzhenica TaxID=1088818 RepID=A0A2I0AUS0_9ASPA|nr:Beta-hexosaminidase 3 [Apostasia shenzhenica]
MAGVSSAALLAGFLLSLSFLADGLNLWPMPASVSYGSGTLYLSNDFQLRTEGSRYSDGSGILKEAFQRMVDIIKIAHVVDGSLPRYGVLKGLRVLVFSADDKLNFGTEESYKLSIPANNKDAYAEIEAQTVYGALHAFETFSQLCNVNLTTNIIELHSAPWKIVDQPRFPYRGLMIDTSRHYLPLQTIKNVIDSMTYAKLNVLHWHAVDRESFPIELPSFPKLWDGAYSYSERYTTADAHEIVQYAERRGINVLAEIDVPGHARSWGIGYPSLWPSSNCQEPLDVSNEFTFQVIDGILSDFSKIFKFKFVHLGGDEVNTSCWTRTPHISNWLKNHGMNGSDAYRYFVLRAQKIALSHGYDVINWEETFNSFGKELSPRTVVHNWLGGGVAQKVAAAGLRCIVSNQDKWYLDHLDATWDGFYMNEPLVNITKPEQQKLIIGGEVCMWGETVDASDIEQTVWPRAAAAAERLWTPLKKLAKDPMLVRTRLAHFRCLLNRRGVAAAPLFGLGRAAPPHQDSCPKQ